MTTDAVELTVNPCAACQPLGAIIAMRGVEGAMTLIHGSQGCGTYMRLYLTRHFREPFDVASSSLNEKEAVYGGTQNLLKGVRNVISRYRPEVLAVTTTCLSETIGDDVPGALRHFVSKKQEKGMDAPSAELIPVSTPSYSGTLSEGYEQAVLAIVRRFVVRRHADPGQHINLLIPHISPAEIREIKSLLRETGIEAVILPDYSETLDPPIGADLPLIPEGGTPRAAIATMAAAITTVVAGEGICEGLTQAGAHIAEAGGTGIEEKMPAGPTVVETLLPLGLGGTDAFFSAVGVNPLPLNIARDRGRLLDAMADAHRITYGRRIGIIGEPHLAVALARFATELGMDVRLVATGSRRPKFTAAALMALQVPEGVRPIDAILGGKTQDAGPSILSDVNFEQFGSAVAEQEVELIIGSSHAATLASDMGVPLVRAGFPIYDRFGGHRQMYAGYRGATLLLDDLCNALLMLQPGHQPIA